MTLYKLNLCLFKFTNKLSKWKKWFIVLERLSQGIGQNLVLLNQKYQRISTTCKGMSICRFTNENLTQDQWMVNIKSLCYLENYIQNENTNKSYKRVVWK